MLSVRTIVNSRLSQRLRKDADAPYSTDEKSKNYLKMTSSRNGTPAMFPALNVDSLGEPSTGDDLEHTKQNAIISTIELKAYTNTSLTDARNLMDKAGDVMLSMGYSLIYGPEGISETSPYTVLARFRRTVGSGDIKNM